MPEAVDRRWVELRLARWREARDGEALGELLKWQRDRAYATALRLAGRSADAEDIVQKAFLKMLSRTRGFETLEEFRAAVYRAVVQCALDEFRSAKARSEREKAMWQRERVPARSSDARAERDEAARELEHALGELDDEDRALVVLCCQEGLSASAASRATGVPRETVRRRLGRSLSSLRSRLSRRGLCLAGAGLIALLRPGGEATAAPAGLCHALDACLPGASCSSIAAAAAAKPGLAAIVTAFGTAAKVKLGTALAAAVTVVTLGGAGLLSSRRDAEAPRPQPREAVAAPVPSEPRRVVIAAPQLVVAPVEPEPVEGATEEIVDYSPETVAPDEAPAVAVAPPVDIFPEPEEAATAAGTKEAVDREEIPRVVYALLGRARRDVCMLVIAEDGTVLAVERRERPERPPLGERGYEPAGRGGNGEERRSGRRPGRGGRNRPRPPVPPHRGRRDDQEGERPRGPLPPPGDGERPDARHREAGRQPEPSSGEVPTPGQSVPIDEVPRVVKDAAAEAVEGFELERAFRRSDSGEGRDGNRPERVP